ncbi:unnamed protein product [Lasius platythorax]|uniref:Uncharacterized protein n=2 Tax=Lasius TaxID=488720 RepID=A0A0J7KCB6_LASNI|nr:hypothetical protein RF55_12563 [Lasius niger]
MIDSQEKSNRRNNIVIRGLDYTPSNCSEVVNSFLSTKFDLTSAVQDVTPRGPNKGWIRMKLINSEVKHKIMSCKAAILRGSIFSLDHDYTPKKRDIMKIGRARIQKEHAEGRQAKMGFLKVCIKGCWRFWSESAKDFIPQASTWKNKSLPRRQRVAQSEENSLSKNLEVLHPNSTGTSSQMET